MKKSLSLLISVVLLLPGCASTPLPVDPFGGLVPDSPYKDMTLALMISENTKQAIEYGRMGRKWARRLGGFDFDPEGLAEDITGMLQRDFKKVIRAEQLADAAPAGADLVAVLDIRAPKFKADLRYAWWLAFFPAFCLILAIGQPTKITVDNGAVFLTPDGRQVESIRVVHLYRRLGKMDVKIHNAYLQARYNLERDMLASETLRNYAKSVRAQGAAAAAAGLSAIHSDVDRPAYLHPVDENLFAVVIGVDAYDHAPRAEYGERDAQAVRDHLLALGYPQRNIAFATGTRAGRAAIEKYVESWLPERAGAGAKVLFYFAGHGAPDVSTGEAYLLPHDGDPKFLGNTGYPVKRLYEKLSALKAGQVVVAMDAGFSGTGGRSVLPQGARPLITEVRDPVPQKLAVLEAASSSEIAGVAQTQGHGLWTYHFLKALQETKGKAGLGDLHERAAKGIADAARREGRDQTPRLLRGRGARLR